MLKSQNEEEDDLPLTELTLLVRLTIDTTGLRTIDEIISQIQEGSSLPSEEDCEE